MDMNEDQKLILIDGKVLDLSHRPVIFEFLKVLASKVGFASKEVISEALWPKETYFPTIHDARIFDIARRTRQILEKNSEQPILLISGRSGYRLNKTHSN